jgi:hypothetical protein
MRSVQLDLSCPTCKNCRNKHSANIHRLMLDDFEMNCRTHWACLLQTPSGIVGSRGNTGEHRQFAEICTILVLVGFAVGAARSPGTVRAIRIEDSDSRT